MADLSTMQGRIEWARSQLLRLEPAELSEALARLPERWRHQVSRETIRRYERGARSVPVEYLAALSELSGVSLDWLIAGRNPVGDALDALRRVRYALDQIEEQYLTDPIPPDPGMYRRIDPDDHDGGSSRSSSR